MSCELQARLSAVSSKKGYRRPDSEQYAHQDQEGDTSRSIARLVQAFGCLALPVFPPGQAVTDDQGQAQRQYELRQQIGEVEDVAHDRDRNGG